MPRPKTKEELVLASKENYEKLNRFISQLSEDELQTPFDFSRDPKKKEAHWKRDKNLRDVLIHLYEWHQLLLTWVHSNQKGHERTFLPESYNWKTYGQMNDAFWKKHQKTSLEEATILLEQSHKEVLELIEVFSNDELFAKGIYQWTGGTSLGSYFVSSTSSCLYFKSYKIKLEFSNLL
ncbi:ClbS/DfsB family four-helix bundle protein [Streptococcus mitis]|uniref:ClbS/DfsB family four-helix bundle protein n=1 Tax=Streptococcus mitis TaxID=28037 RepID=UPI0021B75B2E|nr:ClbS/DfsB family four-helix bundle protein [Streptococcus mitis]